MDKAVVHQSNSIAQRRRHRRRLYLASVSVRTRSHRPVKQAKAVDILHSDFIFRDIFCALTVKSISPTLPLINDFPKWA